MAVNSALIFLIGVVALSAEQLAQPSFKAPFSDVDTHGARIVPGFQVGGHAMVMKNFVRLTNDRQSKRGHMWSVSPLGVPEWSLNFKFRISGQGKTLFGDGIALWITSNPYYPEGAFHGLTDTFTGFGVIFDTFRNTEAGSAHKDVSLVWNDGTRDVSTMTSGHVGCDAALRYHEGRADFSVFNASRARLQFKAGVLSVDIDPKNDNTWVTCASISDATLPAGWSEKAYIGVTASTGQLADNHDALGLKVYNIADEAASEECAVPEILPEKLDQMIHELEHKLVSFHDGLTNSIAKLRKKEEQDETRILALEQSIKSDVENTLTDRILALESLGLQRIQEHDRIQESRLLALENKVAQSIEDRISRMEHLMDQKVMSSMEDRIRHMEKILETKVHSSLTERTNRLETRIQDNMNERMEHHVKEKIVTHGNAWQIPFGVLMVFVLAVFLFVWRKYVALRKEHLL